MTREEAIDIIRKNIPHLGIGATEMTDALTELIPELHESEDETTREELIDYLRAVIKEVGGLGHPIIDKWIAWLEKQKEQKPNYCHHEVDETGWTEEYRKAYYDGWNNCNMQHEQLKADQKPAEWNDTDMKEARNNLISVCRDWERGQQTTLLPIAAIRARYFLEHLTEPKPAEWSEDDEQYLLICKNALSKYQRSDQWDANIISNWLEKRLKSLRPQPKQEWSKKDKKILQSLHHVMNCADAQNVVKRDGLSVADVCNFLFPIEPYWKPTEEQMRALEDVITMKRAGNEFAETRLREIYEQLKKL